MNVLFLENIMLLVCEIYNLQWLLAS